MFSLVLPLSQIRVVLSLSLCSTLEACQLTPLLTCQQATAPHRPPTPCRDTASTPTSLCHMASLLSASSHRWALSTTSLYTNITRENSVQCILLLSDLRLPSWTQSFQFEWKLDFVMLFELCRLMSQQVCQDLTTLGVTAPHLSCCTTLLLSRAVAPTPNMAHHPNREHHSTSTLGLPKVKHTGQNPCWVCWQRLKFKRVKVY